MAEQEVIVEKKEEKTEPVNTNPFAGNLWTEAVPEIKVEKREEKSEPAKTDPLKAEEEFETVDPEVWFKNEFKDYGFENPAKAKEQLAEWKKRLESTPEIKYENDQSKHIHELIREGKTKEVRQFLETQEKLETYLSGEVTKENADDIIKLGMKMKYRDLTDSEINYKFNKQYLLPKEPIQAAEEPEEEFTIRKAEWQEKVNDILQEKLIEAKLARPELEVAKVKLVLPELPKQEPKLSEADQKLLIEQQATLKSQRENFLNKLQSDYIKADSFETRIKDESVDIPVTFKIPEDVRTSIKSRLEEGFNTDEYIDSRWFEKDGAPKIEQIVKDIFILEHLDKVLSGVANNSASKRLDAYRQEVSNISVNGKPAQNTFQPDGKQKSVNPYGKDAWSEKPPVVTLQT